MPYYLLKLVVIIFLLTIIYNLGKGLQALVSSDVKHNNAKHLSWRVGLSFFLFVLLLICYQQKWLLPNNII